MEGETYFDFHDGVTMQGKIHRGMRSLEYSRNEKQLMSPFDLVALHWQTPHFGNNLIYLRYFQSTETLSVEIHDLHYQLQ